ncbi:hypothetical protein JZ751_003976 [Albula glossodonta]|uniref:Uncharacterized protein n=1 Tax=Albula glossodonta TaxID=121402 RepID=A0A8T2P6R2_9TELE|nr:hypothetical protein JZ751_003976 [Albula glossodonta]
MLAAACPSSNDKLPLCHLGYYGYNCPLTVARPALTCPTWPVVWESALPGLWKRKTDFVALLRYEGEPGGVEKFECKNTIHYWLMTRVQVVQITGKQGIGRDNERRGTCNPQTNCLLPWLGSCVVNCMQAGYRGSLGLVASLKV